MRIIQNKKEEGDRDRFYSASDSSDDDDGGGDGGDDGNDDDNNNDDNDGMLPLLQHLIRPLHLMDEVSVLSTNLLL